jgi:hypothetical protein
MAALRESFCHALAKSLHGRCHLAAAEHAATNHGTGTVKDGDGHGLALGKLAGELHALRILQCLAKGFGIVERHTGLLHGLQHTAGHLQRIAGGTAGFGKTCSGTDESTRHGTDARHWGTHRGTGPEANGHTVRRLLDHLAGKG